MLRNGLLTVLLLLTVPVQAAVFNGFTVKAVDNAWEGKTTHMATTYVNAFTTLEDCELRIGFMRTDHQEGLSQGSAIMLLLSPLFWGNRGQVSWKVFYADSSSRVITQYKAMNDTTADLMVELVSGDEGSSYQYGGAMVMRRDDQILKNAVKLVVRVRWDSQSQANASTQADLVFYRDDLVEARKVLNYEFSR